MVAEPLFLVVHLFAHRGDLAQHVAAVAAAEVLLVHGREDLRHIDAVEPDLVGIDLLVPEVALDRAGLPQQLAVQLVRGETVFLVPVDTVKLEQHAAFVDVVEVIARLVIALDRAVGREKIIHIVTDKFTVAHIAADLGHREQGRQHAAVDVVPAGSLALAHSLDIPGGRLGGRALDQRVDISVDLRGVHAHSSVTLPQFTGMSASPSCPVSVTFLIRTRCTFSR